MKAYLIIQQTEQSTWLHKTKFWVGKFFKFLYLYKMKVQFTDNGEVIEVQNYVEIVDHMRESAPHLADQSNRLYMMGYAYRSVVSNDVDIDATSEERFISDLIDKGYIKILEN